MPLRQDNIIAYDDEDILVLVLASESFKSPTFGCHASSRQIQDL